MRSFAVIVLSVLLQGAQARAAGPPDPVAWFLIATERGEVLGHASREVRPRPGGREILDVEQLDLLGEDGSTTRIVQRTTTHEDEAGRVVFLSASTDTGGVFARTEAQLWGPEAHIRHTSRSGAREASIALPADVRFDAGLGLIPTWDPAVRPELRFRQIDIESMQVGEVVLTLGAPDGATPPGGLSVVSRRYQGGELLGVVKFQLDAERRLAFTVQPMFGTSVSIKPTDRATALRRHRPYRPLGGAVMKSPYRILDAATAGQIRYHFTFRDGLSFPPPQTAEQRVRLEGGVAVLDVCATCGPGLASDAASLAEARRPTAWLQSDHERLALLADPIARLDVPDARKMELLSGVTRARLERLEFTGHYSALDAILRRSGDCTESALVLAALGRAAGIPTRVVNGLVYSRGAYHGFSNVFMPHSWVAAYVDGAWKSFDAALGSFDSTHIALTIGDGDPRSVGAASQLASLLVWEQMAEVRPRPSA